MIFANTSIAVSTCSYAFRDGEHKIRNKNL